MLADPIVAVQRDDFVHAVTEANLIDCRSYHTVTAHPGAAPAALPARGLGRPSQVRLAAEGVFNQQAAAYAAALAVWTAANPDGEAAGEPDAPNPDMICTHERRSPLDNPALVSFTEGWARTQVALSFVNDGELNERAGTFRHLMVTYPSATTLGGKSFGARSATRGSIYSPANKLVMFTYPLSHSTEDAGEDLVVADGQSRSCFMIAAMWNVVRDLALTELTLDWDGGANEPKWTTWVAPTVDLPKPATTFNVNILNPGLPGGGGTITFTM
ncbi:uncharacterized protein RCO7_06013 [Rhynchosporium graminicola]|uniref:Uncharacterized protein n=1 Tax=Rhynchosporium graminicola TaxID=2792576 RepID=A0A1E1KXI6_9HELO|nr:uncharacterized protein RCO7_06013 [Rhynchosporium commune]